MNLIVELKVSDDSDLKRLEGTIETIKAELASSEPSKRRKILEMIALAVLGSIPWVGGALAAAATFGFGETDSKGDALRDQWLAEHHHKLMLLRATLDEMFGRLNGLGGEIDERLQSPEYLALVRKAFREWDQADTDEKRRLIVQLITNAAGTRIASDDILRLFLNWIESYHESHFAVIREIHRNPGPTRHDIWIAVYGKQIPREDSAEADLYKMLIRDLSTGGVIRQARETDAYGRFRKKPSHSTRSAGTGVMKSAFDDTEQYVLTELGKQFVHYSMTELVARLEQATDSGQTFNS
jgi:hypothetical protein